MTASAAIMKGDYSVKKRGFTLIELLVVIAIIAILAAILFPVFVNAKERGRMARCLSNLKNMVTAAKMYSDDPGSNQTGGDLGTISKGEMVKEFEDAVFSQKKDVISDPVKSAYGYHIIQVTGITAAKQYTLAEVKDEIKSTLLTNKKSDTWAAWIKDQKTKVGVVYAKGWVSHPDHATVSLPCWCEVHPSTEVRSDGRGRTFAVAFLD